MGSEDSTSTEVDRLVRQAARMARRGEESAAVEADIEQAGGTDVAEDVSDGSEDDEDNGEGAASATKRKRRTKAEKAAAEGRAPTIQELEVNDLLPKDLPDAVESVKTLSDLMARWNIGQDPEFKVDIYRQYPKMFPGGMKADGFYDTWNEPLTNEMIQSEYGGGSYRVAIMGPNPKNASLQKHYDSIVVQYPGEANYSRLPRAMQARQVREQGGGDFAQPPPIPMQGEHPKLAEAALSTMAGIVTAEREERHRMGARAETVATAGQAGVQPVVEAERRRADDLIAAERRLVHTEREHMEQRLTEERGRIAALEQRIEEMRMESQSRPSVASELREVLSMPQFNGGGDRAASERMLENVLQKHGQELERIASQHTVAMAGAQQQAQGAMESARQSHQTEIAALREAARREVEAERDSARRQLEAEKESARRREERSEDVLKLEREERRRDQERFREQLAERDQQWKDRMDNQKQMIEQSWDSRHSATVSNYEQRVLSLQGEVDRLKEDLRDAKTRVNEQNDPLAQLAKARELREAITGKSVV